MHASTPLELINGTKMAALLRYHPFTLLWQSLGVLGKPVQALNRVHVHYKKKALYIRFNFVIAMLYFISNGV